MQLSIGVCDLSSIEPCDKNFFPLRLCATSRPRIAKLKTKLRKYFYLVDGNLKGRTSEILRDSNDYEDQRKIEDHKVTEKMWNTYEEYLEIMYKGFQDFIKLDSKRPTNKGVYLKKMSKRCLKMANEKAKKVGTRLMNMWDWMGF